MENTNLTDMLNKIAAISDGVNQAYIILCGVQDIVEHSIVNGELKRIEYCNIEYIDIGRCIRKNTIQRSQMDHLSKDKLKTLLTIVPKDTNIDYLMRQLASVVATTTIVLSKEVMDLEQDSNIILEVLGEKPKKSGLTGIVFGSQDSVYANVLYDSISEAKNFNKDTVQKIANAMCQKVLDHVDIDTHDSMQVDKLRKDIEFTIIKHLPAGSSLDSVNVNMDLIIEEIQKLQEQSPGFDTDPDNF